MDEPLPAELALTALAGRYAQADQQIRALVAQAPEGDRAALLAQALAILTALRADNAAGGAVGATIYAYAVAALATRQLTGRPSPNPARALALGRGLQLGLDRGIVTAQDRTRAAFATATPDNAHEAAQDAVTARVDRAGARHGLGPEAAMRTTTVGRHAVVRATFDTIDQDATVTIGGGSCPICIPRQGTFPAHAAPRPPFHPHCDCTASPADYSIGRYVGAMRQAVAAVP